jgi:hypothetical protein
MTKRESDNVDSTGEHSVSQIVVLVGAGVSIPIGIPAMRGIYSAFLNKTKSDITSAEKRTCEFLTKELGVEKDLEEFLLAANAVAEFESSSLAPFVEKAISARKTAGRLREYHDRLNTRIKDVLAVRTRILDFMSKTCFRFDRAKACDIFGGFVDAVSQKGCPIYSTNYDFALEHVAIERQIAIEDNFREQGQRQLWDRDIRFSTGNVLTLIKLHGSVTWYAADDGTVEKIYNDTSINPVGRDITRLVIFPTRFKDIYDQHFFALYSHFLSALSDAKVLVIIGHSLRDGYLRAGIIERFRKGDFQLIVIDPVFPDELPSELRAARLGSSGRVTHVPYKFEEFSDDLASIIINSTPSSLAQRCADIVHFRKSRSNKVAIKGNIGSLKAGEIKRFKANVDAYLLPHDRPAHIRVWLEAECVTPDGQKQSRVSHEFLEGGDKLVCTDLSGMIQEEIPLEIRVPDYAQWAKLAGKATLKVGLVRSSAKKPAQIRDHAAIATDERELAYRRGSL